MKVKVKFYGTLKPFSTDAQAFSDNEMEIPEGSRIADLLTSLGITAVQGGTVVVNGRVLPKEEPLFEGALVQVFQVMHGG